MAQGGKQHQGAVLLSLGRGLGWLGSVGVVLTAAVNLQVAVYKRRSRRSELIIPSMTGRVLERGLLGGQRDFTWPVTLVGHVPDKCCMTALPYQVH